MEEIFQWVESLAYYLILVSLISNLIPGGKYERYIRLFTGAVFILLVLRPISGSLNLDEKLAYAYETIRFQQDAGEFETKLWGIEEERTSQIIAQYQEAVAMDVKRMALEEGLQVSSAQVLIEDRAEAEDFGQVKTIELLLEGGEENGEISDGAGENGRGGSSLLEEEADAGTGKAVQVEPVYIQVGEKGEERKIRGPEDRVADQKEQEALNGFQRKLSIYYGLDQENIRVSWEK